MPDPYYDPYITATPTIRQQIVDALEARLNTITIDNGYTVDFSEQVFGWKDSPLPAETPPMLVYRDGKQTFIQSTSTLGRSGYHTFELEIEVEIVTASSGPTTPEAMRSMIGDIYKCIGVDLSFGGLANTVELDGDEMLILDERNTTIGGASVKFVIGFQTRAFDPFNK